MSQYVSNQCSHFVLGDEAKSTGDEAEDETTFNDEIRNSGHDGTWTMGQANVSHAAKGSVLHVTVLCAAFTPPSRLMHAALLQIPFRLDRNNTWAQNQT